MKEISILIGGKAGEGIDTSGTLIGRILSHLGYKIYIYRDYPSLIRGGHTYSIIRACEKQIGSHYNSIDILLALNQQTIDIHKDKLKNNTFILYNSDAGKSEKGTGIPIDKIIKEENGIAVMGNTCIIGALCKAIGINWDIAEKVLKKHIPKETELNLKIAKHGYDYVSQFINIDTGSNEPSALITGNEAISLGLLKAGLTTYMAYPMTPSTGILHFLAQAGITDPTLKTLQPESEIGVILMALGGIYAGERIAIGTSGGGFCLMVEGLSFSSMAELPIVIILGQRTAPSTGLPTYTGQSDLLFAITCGHGGFFRFVVAPGDANQAYFWSALSLSLAWKYQIPSIIISDKTLAEGAYSFLPELLNLQEKDIGLWEKEKSQFKRYLNTETGLSPLAFPGNKNAIIKINSYEHDEYGITTEDPYITKSMQEKRFKKNKLVFEEVEKHETLKIYGNKNSNEAILTWGSNKDVCIEAGEILGMRVIQPIVMSPFPINRLNDALKGVSKIICVENNIDGQLASLVKYYGITVDRKILKYDGRPFTADELINKIKQ
ncbi:MAG: 2-oxoacid:acceptor oxidoreductase subunit alpha [Candidatus Omnitrophica bacterium]|jgi:2-oxoglutarate ferredoxin oxidoreductase subunit alpha|nr:2-oxoacid:acceptor oxidoreductase subunit alpha [Candidatus Omnitrophota bacterium]